MSARRFVLLRLVRLASVLLAVSLGSFLLFGLIPGDPTVTLLGPAAGDPAAVAELRDQLGLGRPLPVRYGIWLGHTVRGDLGESYFTRQPVVDTIVERVPLTLQIALSALVLSVTLAIPLAMLSARRPRGGADRVIGWSMFALIGLPTFTLGIVLIWLFAVRWQFFPPSGIDPWYLVGPGVIATPRSITLPVITLAAGQLAIFTRVLRSDLVLTLREDFIGAARARGLSERRLLVGHALRSSSLPLMTIVGLSLGGLIGGSVIVEQMFALPGIGRLMITSIFKRDYLVVQGIVIMVATTFVLATVAIEVMYVVLDPRIRTGRATS